MQIQREGLSWNRENLNKNKALLAKWIWRFGKEQSSLWKKVLCTKYGLCCEHLVWDFHDLKSCSPFIKSVNELCVVGKSSASVIKKGF